MLVTGTLVPVRLAPLGAQPLLRISAVVLVLAGTLLHAFGVGYQVFGIDVGMIIAPGIAGVGMVHHMIMWGEFYGSVGSQRAALYMTLTILVSVVLDIGISLLPRAAVLVAICLCPLFSMLLIRTTNNETKSHQKLVVVEQERQNTVQNTRRPHPLPLPWIICLAAGSYGMISGLVSSSAPYLAATRMASLGLLSQFAYAAVAFLLFIGVIFFPRTPERGFTYRPALFVMVVGCCLLPFVESFQGLIAIAIVNGGYMYFYALSWIMYADITFRMRLPGHRVYAWGRVFGAVGYAVGMLISFLLSVSSHADWLSPNTLSFLTMILLVATSLFILDERYVLRGWGRNVAVSEPLVDMSASQLALVYKLTKREVEIFGYLVRGRSLAHIQKQLSVSYSTVNTHVANIYRKLGVHNRQELIDLSEQIQSGQGNLSQPPD